MSAKRNVLKSQLPLIVVAATVCLLTLMWFVYRSLGRSRCDSIFEQTADRVQADLKFIKVKGGVTLGAEKLQELTDSSQKVGIHLKSCCIAQQSKALNTEQFQVCMSGAKDYQTQIIQVANNIKEADAAEKQQKPELAKQKAEAAKEEANKVVNTEKNLAKATQALPTPTSVKSGAEQEPNNNIPHANAAEIATTIDGEINPADDEDFFEFKYQDGKKRRDIVVVCLENKSTTLLPWLASFKRDKSVDRDWKAPNTAGADLDFLFSAESGKTYYVGVRSLYGHSTGGYTLSVVPQKAYDQYEPNDDAYTSTPLKVGQTIEANIMDGADVDSYKVSGVTGKSLTVDLGLQPNVRSQESAKCDTAMAERSMTKFHPWVRVLKSDMSIAQDWMAPNAPANLMFSIPSEPGQDYFVEVTSKYGNSWGPYKLTVR